MTNLKKGDLVTIGRKKDQYRIKQVSASGEGAVLVETVDQKPYATTYVNADNLKLHGEKVEPVTPVPPARYLVTLTSPAGAIEVTVDAYDQDEAVTLAKATLPTDATAPVITDAHAQLVTAP